MKKKGFTLVELLAVIAILAILVIMALPAILKMFNKARIDSFDNEANIIIRTAREQYLIDGGNINSYSNATGSFNTLKLSSSRDLVYYVELNSQGKITQLIVKNENYQYISNDTIDYVNPDDIQDLNTLSEDEKVTFNSNGITFTCDAGMYLSSDNSCVSCPANSYCEGGTFNHSDESQGLTACPGNMMSVTGASDSSQCYLHCSPGYFLSRTSCSRCSGYAYCTGGNYYYNGNIQGKTACPGGMDAASGAKSISECRRLCNAGYCLLSGATTCSICPPNYYCPRSFGFYHTGSDTQSNSNKHSCPEGTTSSAGSSSIDDCH